MQRNFRRGLLVCLIPCLIALWFVLNALLTWDSSGLHSRPGSGKFRLGIDLAGGTILVYEVNLDRMRQMKLAQGKSDAATGLSSDEMVKLAAQIKKRIDPADILNVTVRPLGDNRIEIILPTGGAGLGGRQALNAEQIEEVKRQVSQMGVLEFRILANLEDDSAGIDEITRLINTPSDETKAALLAAAKANLAPPIVLDDTTREPRKYDVKAMSSEAIPVSYAWAELSPEERESLQLNNAAEAAGSPLWQQLAQARALGQPVVVHRSATGAGQEDGGQWTYSMVLFSREVHADSEVAQREREKKAAGEEVDEKKYEYFLLTRISDEDNLRIEGDITITARSDTDPRTFDPCVSFSFNGAGASKFRSITKRNEKKKDGGTIRNLAIVLDQKVISAPTLNAVIGAQGQISGKFDRKSVDRLVGLIRSGALSAQLKDKPVSENTIGPTLGADTIRKGTLAVGLSFAVVLIFMVIYYEFAGFVACVALLANLLLTVGFMVGVNAAFTLPGLAGLVLMLGMAVDANVLIYERIREERDKGANLATAIRNGYDRAFATIIDTHLTSIFTAVVLYTFGNDQLKGFAISLTVGLIISLFTSLYITRLMFDYWLHRRWITELRMRRFFTRPNFNPMRYRFVFFSVTTGLTVIGLAMFLVRGDQILNVDFRGGTVYAAKLREGEERALTTTPDGKLGFRELLSEERQKDLLRVERLEWANKPAGENPSPGSVNTWVFNVTYVGGETTIVTLTEQLADTEQEMLDRLKQRLESLPDVSVEQMYLSEEGDFPGKEMGKSRYFTLRTTERQSDIVRASLNRLLRDEEKRPLVPGPHMSFDRISGPRVAIKFDVPVSRNLLQDVIRERLQNAGVDASAGSFRLLNPETGSDLAVGRYESVVLDLTNHPQYGPELRPLALNGPAGAAVLGVAGVAGSKELQVADRTAADVNQMLTQTQQSLKSRPEPLRLEVFDSQLASDTRDKAFYAIIASWIAILLYLWFRFGNWTFGLAAVLCLTHDLCFTLGAIAACHYLHDTTLGHALGLHDFKIDLAAVAALLTLVGYSVCDTIVVFDRIREVRGKNPALTPQIINDSVNQTLSRTLLAAATVFLVSIVLYIAGGEGIHLFAFVMVMGVIVGTYSSIFVASPLLLFLGEGSHATETTATPEEGEGTRPDDESPVVEG